MSPSTSLFSPAIQGFLEGRITAVSGLWGSSKALFAARLQAETRRPLLLILPTEEAAEERFHDLEFYARWQGEETQVSFFPSWEVLPYDSFSPHAGLIHRRMTTLHTLLTGNPSIVVASVPAAIQRLIPRKRLQEAVRSIRIGLEIPPERLCAHLVEIGYEPVSAVTQRGEFSPRGGILDLYSPVEPFPLRIEFFGDRVESLRWFDPETQRSLASGEAPNREEALLFPAREIFGPDLPPSGGESLAPQVYGSLETLFDYAGGDRPDDLIVIHEEPAEIRKKTREFLDKAAESYAIHQERGEDVPPPDALYLTEEPFFAPRTLSLTSLALAGEGVELPIRSVEGFVNLKKPASGAAKGLPLETAAREIDRIRHDHLVILVCATEGQRERVRELLEEYDTPAAPVSPEEIGPLAQTPGVKPVLLLTGKVSTGFADSEDRLLLITDEEIFGKKFRGRGTDRGERGTSKSKGKGTRVSFEELRPGDFIVHEQHGIGRYEGLKHLTLNHAEGDYLIIRYAGDGTVYLPVDKIQMVQKYVGSEGHPPVIDRLGGGRWERTKKKVQKAVEEIARDLLDLYAERELAPGFAYSADSTLMKELEATFEYDETPDQSAAIEAVKRSMEAHRPMDHLVCGDVGFGKTEVAIRAAGKAVMDGKQVAVLVPTTLLAQQHFQNFSSRFAPFPVRVEMLSRFRTRQEQLEILKDVTAGKVDIVIGTHRLLSKDLQFRDLGLVVLDEEQRFGVAQKERLKQMKKTVDVLTLTATPIPRTLQMGLTSLREMSVIETPPVDRLSIRTLLAPFDRRIIREAILRELERDGQIFFVHNRVQSIYRMAEFLQEAIPEARFGVAHGQMREGPLEDVMSKFMRREFDVLLTTAIIEAGLDIPRANTILINRADRFGLADLYQLRGRVGRSGHQAYAYLLIPPEEVLTEEAEKRLKAIQDFTELGSAFRLAMRDLEIRGTGNLLGRQQSGHIAAVGLDLYLEMMEKTVKALRETGGVAVEEELDPTLNLQLAAFLPENYIADPGQRLFLYKRIASLREPEEIPALRDELADRFGALPPPVETLLEVMGIKVLARRARVAKIERSGDTVFLTLDPSARPGESWISRLVANYRGNLRFLSEYTFQIRTGGEWATTAEEIKNCLQELVGYV